MKIRMSHLCPAAAVLLSLGACAGPGPALTEPGTGTLWGAVGLARRDGVKPVKKDDPVYADKRLGDVEAVDYRRPGFVVVHLTGGPSPGGNAQISFRAGPGGSPTFQPPFAAAGRGGVVLLRNEDTSAHTFSCPEADLLRRLGPGESASISAAAPGRWRIFAIDVRGSEGQVYVAPGRYAVAADDGRWELSGLPPGEARVQAWHPRFPPASRTVNVPRDGALRVDLELRVENVGQDP